MFHHTADWRHTNANIVQDQGFDIDSNSYVAKAHSTNAGAALLPILQFMGIKVLAVFSHLYSALAVKYSLVRLLAAICNSISAPISTCPWKALVMAESMVYKLYNN